MSTRFQLVATDVEALCGLAAGDAPPGVRIELKRLTTSRDQQVVAVARLTVARGVAPRTVTEWLASGFEHSSGALLVDGIEVRLPKPGRAFVRRSARYPLACAALRGAR